MQYSMKVLYKYNNIFRENKFTYFKIYFGCRIVKYMIIMIHFKKLKERNLKYYHCKKKQYITKNEIILIITITLK